MQSTFSSFFKLKKFISYSDKNMTLLKVSNTFTSNQNFKKHDEYWVLQCMITRTTIAYKKNINNNKVL